MGGVIKNWVLTKLGLPLSEYTDPVEFGKGLSNGYLIGEILRKYSVISDDQMIALCHNYEEETRMKNFKNIQRWMSESRFQVYFTELLDIMEEKPGAALKFLYKLYFYLEGSPIKIKEDEDGPVIAEIRGFDNSQKGKKKKRRARKKSLLLNDADEKPDLQIGARLTCAVEKIKKYLSQKSCPPKDDDRFDETEMEPLAEEEFVEEEDSDKDPQSIAEIFSKKAQKMPKDPKWKYFSKHLCAEKMNICSENTLNSFNPPPLSSPPPDMNDLIMSKIETCPMPEKQLFPIKGDTFQATNLYFASEAIRKVKNDKENVLQCLYNIKLRMENGYSRPEEQYSTTSFKMSTIMKQKKFEQLKFKIREEFRLSKEMNTFDDMVQDPDYIQRVNRRYTHGYAAGDQIFLEEDFQPVFKSDLNQHEKRLEKLKHNRRLDSEMAVERNLMRKSLSSKMIKAIPQQMYDDLLTTCINKAMAIYGKEVELADFMNNTHREKSVFYEHMLYEDTALQQLQCDQEDKYSLQKIRDEELKSTIAETAARRSERTFQVLKRQQAEAHHKKIARDVLDAILEFVIKISEYKSTNQDDPPESVLQEWKVELELIAIENP